MAIQLTDRQQEIIDLMKKGMCPKSNFTEIIHWP